MTLTPTPKISVCIPNYNYGRYITEAIESVLCQTFEDFELVIVDNCSNDNSIDIIKKFSTSDSRLKCFFNKQNVGMANNWNLCLNYARGEYIKILCADDLLMPSYLENTIDAFMNHPSAVMVSCARSITNEYLERIMVLSYSDRNMVEKGADVIKRCIQGGNLIGEPTATIFKKSAASRGFDPNYKHLIDFEMWLHLLETGDYVFIPDELCLFRQHDNQGTKYNFRSLEFVDDEINIYNKYKDRLSFFEKQRVKSKLTMLIWNCNNMSSILDEIRKIYSLPLFLILLLVRTIRNNFYKA